MTLPTCLASAGSQYRTLLGSLHITGDEEAQVLPVLNFLDSLDGACDGKLQPLSYENLKNAAEKIAAMKLTPHRRLEIRNALITQIQPNDFAAFVAKPYHETLQFLTHNPIFADTILPHIKPKGLWTDELAGLVKTIQDSPQEGPDAYAKLVDQLYDRTGLSQLNVLLDKADRARIRESAEPRDDKSLFLGKPQAPRSASATKLLGMMDLPTLPDWARVNPALIPTLLTQKSLAETEFATTLFDKIDSLPEGMRKDPLTYWVPLMKLATSEPESPEVSSSHYSVLQALYTKARVFAYDDVMGILFDVEYADYMGEPMTIAKLDQKIGDIRKKITEVRPQLYVLPNDQPESSTERVGRYYSAIGHLMTRKYGIAISSMTPDLKQIAHIESEVEALLQERRDKTTTDEALVYSDVVNMIASVWSAEGGMMTQKLMMAGLPKAREELTRLSTLENLFETLCNGHAEDPLGGEQLREKLADLRWKVLGESCFRAGLPKEGLTSLKNERRKFQNTKAYADHIVELAKQYPWLVDKSGKITLDQVGENGVEAEATTDAMFYSSRETGREVALPLVGAAVGSLGGPWGSFAGGYAGKAINHFANRNSKEAEDILSGARATGIPLISKELSEQLTHAEFVDLATCGVSSLLMFRFYRSALSLSRGVAQASYRYVASGGLRATAKTAIHNMTVSNIQTAGRVLTGKAVTGVKNIPSAVRALPGLAAETYGKHGVWPTTKYVLSHYGTSMRVVASLGMLADDYLPDHEFNTWAGPLGASLLINDVYGKVVWGWNANGGLVGFAWRYGIELGVQWMQGIPISQPNMNMTVVGMFAAYTLKGVNKLYTLGRAETHSSPILQRVAHFVEKNDVLVPRSVVGLTRIKAKNGMVRGLATLIGKPAKKLSADLPDGTILRVVEADKTATEYVVHVVRKATGPSGRPIAVVTEKLTGVPFEEVTEMRLPRATELGRKMYRTVHNSLSEAGVYRLPNAVMKLFKIQPAWWVKLGERVGTADKPIFNFRGSIANAGDLPILALAGAGFGVFQGTDPEMQGLYRAADYGISFFFQHKIQHVLKIDSPVGTFVGYALGIPFSVLSLPQIFPTAINKAPALTKKCEGTPLCEEGYFASMAAGDDEGANKALQLAVTSMTPLANAPLVGHYVWNKVTPFGSVEDSNYRIEEKGAAAYWNTMLKILNKSDSDPKAKADVTRVIDKVARDCHRYLVMHDLPKDPVKLRLLVLELAFVKRLMRDKSHNDLMRHAATYSILKEATERIPTIRTDLDLRRMITGLNVNESVGTAN